MPLAGITRSAREIPSDQQEPACKEDCVERREGVSGPKLGPGQAKAAQGPDPKPPIYAPSHSKMVSWSLRLAAKPRRPFSPSGLTSQHMALTKDVTEGTGEIAGGVEQDTLGSNSIIPPDKPKLGGARTCSRNFFVCWQECLGHEKGDHCILSKRTLTSGFGRVSALPS